MSVTSVVTQIDNQTLQYAPAAIAAIQAAEQSAASGTTKKQVVLNSIITGAKVGETIPVPQVQAISGMIDLFVSIFNALGLFSHKVTP